MGGTCTRTWYARNDTLGINSLVSRTRTVGRVCSAAETDLSLPTSTASRGDVLSGTATVYDNTSATAWTASQPPTVGEPSRTGRATAYPASDISGERHPTAWQTTAKSTYDTLGRALTATDAGGNTTTTTYTPTAAGPLTRTKVTNAAGHSTYTSPDPATGQPVKIYDANLKKTDLTYDADGNLLERRSTAGESVLYLGATEVHYDAATGDIRGQRYYSAGSTRIAVRTNESGTETLSFLAGDAHGTSTLAVAATDLAVTKRYFTPFGESRQGGTGTWVDDKAFLGMTADDDTGLTHIGAREYDPSIGRFISVDPKKLNLQTVAYGIAYARKCNVDETLVMALLMQEQPFYTAWPNSLSSLAKVAISALGKWTQRAVGKDPSVGPVQMKSATARDVLVSAGYDDFKKVSLDVIRQALSVNEEFAISVAVLKLKVDISSGASIQRWPVKVRAVRGIIAAGYSVRRCGRLLFQRREGVWMIRQRARAVRFAAAALATATLVVGWVLIRDWMELPGVPGDVVRSVESRQVHILAEGSGSSPGNDWENSYALISVSSQENPAEDIEAALRSAGWTTRLGVSDPLLVSGDSPQSNPKYGVTVQTYENFGCLDRSGVCGKFEKAAGSQGQNLFVATFMPYV